MVFGGVVVLCGEVDPEVTEHGAATEQIRDRHRRLLDILPVHSMQLEALEAGEGGQELGASACLALLTTAIASSFKLSFMSLALVKLRTSRQKVARSRSGTLDHCSCSRCPGKIRGPLVPTPVAVN